MYYLQMPLMSVSSMSFLNAFSRDPSHLKRTQVQVTYVIFLTDANNFFTTDDMSGAETKRSELSDRICKCLVVKREMITDFF